MIASQEQIITKNHHHLLLISAKVEKILRKTRNLKTENKTHWNMTRAKFKQNGGKLKGKHFLIPLFITIRVQ